MINTNTNRLVSLYDFLGHPAGSQLGKDVYKIASHLGVKTSIREVSNRKYAGKIMLYPYAFLDWYFNAYIR